MALRTWSLQLSRSLSRAGQVCLGVWPSYRRRRPDGRTSTPRASRGATPESTLESQSGFSVPIWSNTSAAVFLFVPRNVIAIREDLTLELYHRDATDGAVWRATSSRRMRIPKTWHARSVKLRDSRPSMKLLASFSAGLPSLSHFALGNV